MVSMCLLEGSSVLCTLYRLCTREGFQPEKHNLYLVEQRLWREQERRQQEASRRRREAWARLREDLGDDTQPGGVSWPR